MTEDKKILIIDDDGDFLDATSAILENGGFIISTAQNFNDALSKVGDFNPDLILCDMMMEEIDTGLQIAKRIKEQKCLAPIYLLSSLADSLILNYDIYELGFLGTIQKPVDKDMIVELLKRNK